MKKFFMWLVLGAMILSTVLFTLGCPKEPNPADQNVPPIAPAGDAGGDAGGTDEGGE